MEGQCNGTCARQPRQPPVEHQKNKKTMKAREMGRREGCPLCGCGDAVMADYLMARGALVIVLQGGGMAGGLWTPSAPSFASCAR